LNITVHTIYNKAHIVTKYGAHVYTKKNKEKERLI